MTQQFKPGDIVRLKSGGPNMTVDRYDDFEGEPYSGRKPEPRYTVVYHQGESMRFHQFREEMLELAQDDKTVERSQSELYSAASTSGTPPTVIPPEPITVEQALSIARAQEILSDSVSDEQTKARARAEFHRMASETTQEAAMSARDAAQISELSAQISHLKMQNLAMKNSLKTGSYYAGEVMSALEEHGSAIVPYLMDTDDNAGENLRKWVHIVKSSIERERADQIRLADHD